MLRMLVPQEVAGMGMPGAVAWLEPPFPGAQEGFARAGRRERSRLSRELSPRSKPAWVWPSSPRPSIRVLPSQMSPGVLEPLLGGFMPRLLMPLSQHLAPTLSSLLIFLSCVSHCPSLCQAGLDVPTAHPKGFGHTEHPHPAYPQAREQNWFFQKS